MYRSLSRTTSGIRHNGEGQQPPREYNNSSSIEGVTTQLKLLLKIIEDHKKAIRNNRNDGRKRLRVATMLTILENIRVGIQRCQFQTKTTETDLGPSGSSNSDGEQHQRRYSQEDEIEMLRKKLQEISEVRKNLQLSIANLTEEKKRITAKIPRILHLIKDTEQRINDLKPHNRLLANKVKKCHCEHTNILLYAIRGFPGVRSLRRFFTVLRQKRETAILLENIHILMNSLQNAVCNYELIEIQEKEVEQMNSRIRGQIKIILGKVNAGRQKLIQFKQNMASRPGNTPAYIAEEITLLEHLFQHFQNMIVK